MKISVGMRIYISSSASVDLSAGDDIPKELLEKVPVIFRTTAVEYDKRRFMGNLRATNDLEISYSSSGIVIIKRGELIPDAVLDKVPDAFKTSEVIPPAPSAETNAKNIAKNKIAIDANKTDIADNNAKATKMTSTAISVGRVGENNVSHWITVAKSTDNITFGKIIVSDNTSGRMSFITIEWTRSLWNSDFNLSDVKLVTGVRILRDLADTVYGEKLLQIQISKDVVLSSSVISNYNNPGVTPAIAVSPVVEDTKTGFGIFKELTNLEDGVIGCSRGGYFGSDIYVKGKLVGLDKAKCFVDITAGDFSGDKDTYGRIVIGNIKYQTPGNNFTVDATTNEIIINREGYYNIEVVLNHSKGASTSVFSNARIQKNSNNTLASGSSGNTDGCSFSLVIRALGEKLSVGDKICIESNGKNDSSPWSTFSIEEV